MKIKLIFAVSTTAFLISSCSAPGVKPEDSNILTAAGNLRTGEFKRQREDLAFGVMSSAADLKNERRKTAGMQHTLVRQQQQIQQLHAEFNQLQAENEQLAIQINAKKATTFAEQAKKSQALAQLATVNENISRLKSRRKRVIKAKRRQAIAVKKQEKAMAIAARRKAKRRQAIAVKKQEKAIVVVARRKTKRTKAKVKIAKAATSKKSRVSDAETRKYRQELKQLREEVQGLRKMAAS